MKILMVNDYKEQIAGTEVYMFTLMEGLKKNGHEVELFATDTSKQEYFSPTYNKSFTKYLKRLFDMRYYQAFKAMIHEFKPDIIHIHNIFNEITPSILYNLNHDAILMTVHDSRLISPVSQQTERTGKPCKEKICEGCTNCVGVKGYLYEILKKKIYRKLLKKISLYITPSKYLQSLLQEKHYLPVICLYNGISLLPFTKIREINQLLYAGRLTPEKGISHLLEAVKKLKENKENITLTIAGEGGYKEDLENMVEKLDIQKQVVFLGAVSSDKLEKLYKASTVILIPSIYPDNLPTVGLEALSAGRPLIGSSIGGIPEIIQEGITGFLTKPGDSESIADLVKNLIHDKKTLEKMNSECRRYAEENFAISQHLADIEGQYRSLLKAEHNNKIA